MAARRLNSVPKGTLHGIRSHSLTSRCVCVALIALTIERHRHASDADLGDAMYELEATREAVGASVRPNA